MNRINESVDWTDEVISDLEAAEDEYEAENVEPSEEKDEGSKEEEVTEEETNDIKKEEVSWKQSDRISRSWRTSDGKG